MIGREDGCLRQYGNSRILVTGASGFIGQYVTRQLVQDGYEVYSIYRTKEPTSGLPVRGDLTSSLELEVIFHKVSPDVIIHLAAMTDVDQCEINPKYCEKMNVEATANLCSLCKGKFLVFISTDYIFDGAKGNYGETDEPNPINYYGKSKLDAEKYVIKHGNYCIIRISTPFAVSEVKPVFAVQTIAKLLQGSNVSVIKDQYVTSTYVPVLAQAISEAVAKRLSGIFNVATDKCVSRSQFVKDCASLLGADTSLISELEAGRINWKAKRPLYSCLNVQKAKDTFTNIDLDYSRTLHSFVSAMQHHQI